MAIALFPVLILFMALIYGATKLSGRTLAIVLGCGVLVMMALMVVRLNVQVSQVSDVQVSEEPTLARTSAAFLRISGETDRPQYSRDLRSGSHVVASSPSPQSSRLMFTTSWLNLLLLAIGIIIVWRLLSQSHNSSTNDEPWEAQRSNTWVWFLAIPAALSVLLFLGLAPLAVQHEPTANQRSVAVALEDEFEYLNRSRIPLSSNARTKQTPQVNLAEAYEEVLGAYNSFSERDKETVKASVAAIAVPDSLDNSEKVTSGEPEVVAEVSMPDTPAANAKPQVAKQKRPTWVDSPPKRVGNVYREVVSSGPHARAVDCHKELDGRMRAVVRQRFKQLVPAAWYSNLERLGLNLDFVLREICREEWVEMVDASFGKMKHVHVLMEFDAAVDKQLQQAYRRYQREHRIEEVGITVMACLIGLVSIYSLLKIDTLTRGYYTKRLFFGFPAAIILLIVFALIVDSM